MDRKFRPLSLARALASTLGSAVAGVLVSELASALASSLAKAIASGDLASGPTPKSRLATSKATAHEDNQGALALAK